MGACQPFPPKHRMTTQLEQEDVLQIVEDRGPPSGKRALTVDQLPGCFEHDIERYQVTVRIVCRSFAVVTDLERLPRHHLAMRSIDDGPHSHVAHTTAEQTIERAWPTTANHMAQHGDACFDVDDRLTGSRMQLGVD